LNPVVGQSYPACIFGDAACASGSSFSSGGTVFCCPNGASVSQYNNDVTCTGGTPAGCAATGKGQPTVEPCTATMQSCASGEQGCVSGDLEAGGFRGMGILSLGYQPCPSGTKPRIDSLQITSTGTFEYSGGLDYYRNGEFQSLRWVASKTPSKCYRLTLPYVVVNGAVSLWVARCANSEPCPYTVISSIKCVAQPDVASACLMGPLETAPVPFYSTPPRPCADNVRSITANDGHQYCCASASATPVFGQAGPGSCTCGQLSANI